MPVFKSGRNKAPAWCELEYFEIVQLKPGESHTFYRIGPKERLVVGKGECRIRIDGKEYIGKLRDKFDLTVTGEKKIKSPSQEAGFEILEAVTGTVVVRMCGHWGDVLGACGVFFVNIPEELKQRGDIADYPKETNFDSHYHDCDEYWILFEGSGTAVSEGVHYEVGVGDCIATGMGYHHDFPKVKEPVSAVFFETTLEGEMRRGHLWEHTHGIAVPKKDRV